MLKKQVDPESWLSDHGDYLFRYALSRLHHEELASDMVQETLLAAWRGHARFKGDSTLRTWLVGIMKHKIIDHIRKEIRDRKINNGLEHDPTSSFFAENGAWEHAPSAWVDNPEARCADLQFRLVLQRCLSNLPEKQQQVFEMRELAGDDTGSICKACYITPTHLHVLMHRARLALQTCLQKHWFGGSNSS